MGEGGFDGRFWGLDLFKVCLLGLEDFEIVRLSVRCWVLFEGCELVVGMDWLFEGL